MFFICRTKYGLPSIVVWPSIGSPSDWRMRWDVDDARAVVLVAQQQRRKVGRVRGRGGFLHLEEQRVVIPVAKEQRQVRAGADAADAHDAVGHVGDTIAAQHEAVGRRKMLGVLGQ